LESRLKPRGQHVSFDFRGRSKKIEPKKKVEMEKTKKTLDFLAKLKIRLLPILTASL